MATLKEPVWPWRAGVIAGKLAGVVRSTSTPSLAQMRSFKSQT
jgi:hypothetical protein